MSRLDRLVLNEIISPFVGSALLFTGLFFAGGELVRYAEFLQRGEGILLVLQLVLYTLPQVIALTFPMAMLLATLLGFGRLSGDSEITAMVAAGISFGRIMTPVAVFGMLVSLLGFWINDTVVPVTTLHKEEMVKAARKDGSMNISSANSLTLTLRDDDHNSLTQIFAYGGVDMQSATQTATMRGVSVAVWKGGAPQIYATAPLAKWTVGTKTWTLYNATVAYLTGATRATSDFPSLSTDDIHAKMDTPQNLTYLERPVEQVTTSGLRQRVRVLRASGSLSDAREAEVEIARRVALPFSSLVFALIGAPLGVRSTRGGKGVGFGLSVLITFSYWLGMEVFSVLAKGGIMPANLALMIPNVVCLTIAVVRIRQVSYTLGR